MDGLEQLPRDQATLARDERDFIVDGSKPGPGEMQIIHWVKCCAAQRVGNALINMYGGGI
jgi:hypothetical protein